MWFALSIPLILMVVAVLLERFEQRCVPHTAVVPLVESTVDLAEPGR